MIKHLLVSIALLSGCVDAVDEQPTTEPIGKLAANALPPGSIQATSLGLATLTPTILTTSGMLNTASGRQFATYLISCAYGAGKSITAPMSISPYTSYTFNGSIGLGALWYSRALTVAERHWVSACVMARSNYYGSSVNISLQGSNSALAIDLDGGFGIDEGAFFGDILSGGAAQLGACMGVDQNNDPSQGDLPLRKCAAGSAWCNFTYFDQCNANCTTSTFPYAGCAPSHWAEVISVKLDGAPD